MGDVDFRLHALEARVSKLEEAAGLKPASDKELDSQYGNPEIKKDPPRWKGPSFVGRRYSECTPEYLENLASFCDWKAGRDAAAGKMTRGGKPLADLVRRDAARARGWANRLREGWKGTPRPLPNYETGRTAPQEKAANDADPWDQLPPDDTDDFGF